MYIRWMGAFRQKGTLRDALLWEFRNASSDRPEEVACEIITDNVPCIPHVTVGLLVGHESVRSRFPHDVWSERNGDGRLIPMREGSDAHWEGFVRPRPWTYRGLVVRGNPKNKTMRTVRWFARTRGLPVYRLKRRRLVLI